MEFKLTKDQEKKYRNWSKKHRAICKLPDQLFAIMSDCIGIVFIPNSIGESVKVECCICHKSLDITDFSLW